MSFSDEERAELIGALSRTADMVAGLLDALDILRVALEAGRQPTEGDLERLREHSALMAPATREAAVTALGADDRATDEGAVISDRPSVTSIHGGVRTRGAHPPQFSNEPPAHRLCPVESAGIQRRGQCLSDRAASTM